MTPGVLAIVIAFLAAAAYAYLVFPVWVALVCANSTMSGTRARMLWLIACILLAPVGSWAYCVFTPQRLHFRVTAWLSLVGTIALVWFVTAFTVAEANAVRQHIDELTARVYRAQMPLDRAQRVEITADLVTLRNEVHGGVFAFKQTSTASTIVDLLDLYLRDGRLAPAECDDWIAQFNARRLFEAGTLELKVQAGARDST